VKNRQQEGKKSEKCGSIGCKRGGIPFLERIWQGGVKNGSKSRPGMQKAKQLGIKKNQAREAKGQARVSWD